MKQEGQERILLNPLQVLDILQEMKEKRNANMSNIKDITINITGNAFYHIIELLAKDENPYFNTNIKNRLEEVLNKNWDVKTRYA